MSATSHNLAPLEPGTRALVLGLGVPAGVWTSLVLGVMVVLALLTIGNRARLALGP